jgi:hypothetical protein
MNTALIISMAACGVCTAIGKKVCESLGEMQISQYIGVGGVSLCGVQAIALVVKLIHSAKSLV